MGRFLTGLRYGHIVTNAQVANAVGGGGGGAGHFWLLQKPREVVSNGHVHLRTESPGELTNRL